MNKINWKQRNWKFKLGIVLILSSMIFFALLVVFPLTSLSNTIKITLTSVSFVVAEVLFYLGGFLLGKELFNKYKAYFNPAKWFRNKKRPRAIIVDNSDNQTENSED